MSCTRMLAVLRNTAFIERWPEFVAARPLTELGSQGHAAVVAWVLATSLTKRGYDINWGQLCDILAYRLLRRGLLSHRCAGVWLHLPPDFVPDMRPGEALTGVLESDCWLAQECRRLAEAFDAAEGGMGLGNSTAVEAVAQVLVSLWELRLAGVTDFSLSCEKTRLELRERLCRYPHVISAADADDPASLVARLLDLAGSLRFRPVQLVPGVRSRLTFLEHSALAAITSYLVARRQGEEAEPRFRNDWALYFTFFGCLLGRLNLGLSGSTTADALLVARVRGTEGADPVDLLSSWLPQFCVDDLKFWGEDNHKNKNWTKGSGSTWPASRYGAFYGGRLVEAADSLWSFWESIELLSLYPANSALTSLARRHWDRRQDYARSGADFCAEYEELALTVGGLGDRPVRKTPG